MAHIIKTQDGFSFIMRQGLNLLEALESQKIEVDFQCRDGFCGCCQVTLVEGKVEYLSEPIAFIPEGKILPCCCQPQSDITIEITENSVAKNKQKNKYL